MLDLRAFAANQSLGDLKEGRILIVDDEAQLVTLLGRVLKVAGFVNVESTSDPTQATFLYLSFRPDVLILDLNMPQLSGFEVMKQLVALELDSFVPILVLTGQKDPELRIKALSSGARDYMEKPFHPLEAISRVRNLMEISLHRRSTLQEKQNLEEEVLARTLELREAQFEIVQKLSVAAEYRDDPSGHHVTRIARYCQTLAPHCGYSNAMADMLSRASMLHDIGKTAIPERILQKEGRLTPDEWEIMKSHAEVGARMLDSSQSSIMKMAQEIARAHHERWDGTGYPSRLAGERIPLAGRLVALCDSFDALTSKRPYKTAWSIEEAVEEIQRGSGSHFDPKLVEIFLAALPQMKKIRAQFP